MPGVTPLSATPASAICTRLPACRARSLEICRDRCQPPARFFRPAALRGDPPRARGAGAGCAAGRGRSGRQRRRAGAAGALGELRRPAGRCHRAPVARLGPGRPPAGRGQHPGTAALGQNLALYRQYQALAASPEAAGFDEARRKVLDNTLRDFRLGGAELAPEAQQRFAAIKEELSALSAKFSQNVLDATDAWSLIIEDEARLAGLPEDVKAAAHAAAEKGGKQGWKLTLQMPC
ncbi:hypothetical protein G6F22_014226 [Rhizopus arrhizus]|nr:hypothetical protein G6F22_014226 [Rhizopus arrhizus]